MEFRSSSSLPTNTNDALYELNTTKKSLLIDGCCTSHDDESKTQTQSNDQNDDEIYSENNNANAKHQRKDTSDLVFQTLLYNIKSAEGNKLRKEGWCRDIYDFHNLSLQEEYKFTIKLSNTITYSESILSDIIIPKTIPDCGIIDKITCDPQSEILRIDPLYPSKSYINKSMQPIKLFIQIIPWVGNDSFVMNDDNKYQIAISENKENENRIEILDKPDCFDPFNNKFVRFEQLIVSKIKLGQEYEIIIHSENIIGKNRSKSYKYIPVKKPPKPIIEYVTKDIENWSMSIHFRANGYDNNDCRAWFEIELIDPTKYKNKNKNDIDEKKQHENMDSIEMYNETLDEFISDPNNFNDEKEENIKDFKSTLHPNMIKILNKKHWNGSPIILTPLFAGLEYIIRIKCCNHQSITYSDIYEPIILNVPPPQPIFTREMATDSAVLLKYECSNYNFFTEFEPEYEIKAAPHHKQAAITKQTQVKIDSLRNGWDYSFKVRAKNQFGESKWSNNVRLKPLKNLMNHPIYI